MKSQSLNMTTALVASLSLTLPHVAFAQQVADNASIATFCETAADAETCILLVEDAVSTGAVVLDENGNVGGDVALVDGQVVIDNNIEAVEGLLGGEAAPTETEATAEVADEQPQTTAESEVAETPDQDTSVENDAPVVVEDVEASAEATTETADVDVEADAATIEPEAEAEVAETPAVEEAPSDTDSATSDADAPATEVEAEADAPTDEASETPQIVEEAAATEAEEVEEVVQVDTEESLETANTAASVEATEAQTTEADAEVEVETVEEADVRSSSEDFDTKVNATAEAASDDGGLSNLEKLLIGTAGAAIVGALLNNGDKVVSNSGDRIVVERDDGGLRVLKDDDLLLRRPGSEVRTQTFNDGSTRTTVIKPNGTQVVTIRSATGQVLQRVRILEDGREIVLFDDTRDIQPVIVSELPIIAPRSGTSDVNDLRQALAAQEQNNARSFSLQQIRQIRAVRELAAEIEVQAVNFDTGSAAIKATEAQELSDLGNTIRDLINDNPNEVFLIEGHTDAVGNAGYNLALSDRRAESVALALTEYFDVPPENMVVQGYGEANLKVVTPTAERQNRRAAVRRITSLLQTAQTRQLRRAVLIWSPIGRPL